MKLLLLLAVSAGMQLYEQASRLFEQRKLPEAASAVEQALKQEPRLAAAWVLKAKLAFAFNRNDLAEACLLRVLEIEPQSEYALFLLGFDYYLMNDFNRALERLKAAQQRNPDDARVLLYLALTYEGLAQTAEALQYYDLAVAAEKKQHTLSPDTLVAYGRLLFTLGRFSASQARVEEALLLDPQSRDAHYELGRLKLQSGEYAGAVKEGEQALTQKSAGTTDRQVFFLLTQAYGKAGDLAKAAEFRRRFEASAPSLRR